MAIIENTFDGGTHGTGMTTGNTGGASGTAFTAVEATLTFSNEWAKSGTLSAKYAATGTSYGRWAFSDRNLATRFYCRTTAAQSADVALGNVRLTSSSSTSIAYVLISAANQLRLRHTATGTNLWTASSGFPTNQDVRVELLVDQGTSSSTGQLRIAYYVGDSLTAVEDSGWLTGLDLRYVEGPITQWFLAKVGSVAHAGSIYVDSAVVRTGADYAGFVGPVSNTPPNVSVTGNQNVAASSTVNVAATASDPDGTIASYAWTYDFPASGGPTITGSTTAAASFTSGSAGALYILRCTVTDNGGATAFATTEVRVPLSGATENRPIAADGTGATWTNTGVAATQGAALADSSDTTYIESPTVTGTETARRWRLQPSNAKAAANVALRLATDSGTANVAIRLYEDSTLRQSWTQAITTTITDYTFALSGGTIAAISDFGNLYVEVGATT